MMLRRLRADEQALGDLAEWKKPLSRRWRTSSSRRVRRPVCTRPRSALGTKRAHERGGLVGVADSTERVELGVRVTGRIDRHLWGDRRQRPSEVESRAGSVQPQAKCGEPVHRRL